MPDRGAERTRPEGLADTIRRLAAVPPGSGPERTLFLLVSLSAALTLVSIVASQVLFFSALALGVVLALRGQAVFRMPAGLALPFFLFFGWTVAAALVSPDPLAGLGIVKKFGLFAVLALGPPVLGAAGRAVWSFRAIFAVCAVASVVGIGQFVANPQRDMLDRIHGFMGQWMTYSGLQMLVLVLLVAYAVAYGGRRAWIVALGLLLVASLYLSYTRNAWLGAVVGAVTVLAMRRPRAILAVLAVALVLVAGGPPRVRARIRASLDREDTTTRGRLELAATSLRIIRDNPWFGLGPKSVKTEALRYRSDFQFPVWLYQHMHNNFFQIAAERGIPGLVLWLWFMVRLAVDARRRLGRLPASGPLATVQAEALAGAAAALGAWSALMVSGLFEYNFGDSEVLLLFLFLMSVPYAAAPGAGDVVLAATVPRRA